ncbi:MAG: hypothetical protein WCT01_00950 [Candidatus Shapirobacteria bacterium]
MSERFTYTPEAREIAPRFQPDVDTLPLELTQAITSRVINKMQLTKPLKFN